MKSGFARAFIGLIVVVVLVAFLLPVLFGQPTH